MRRLFLTVLLFPCFIQAQNEFANSFDLSVSRERLLNFWQFKNGDSTVWSNPAYNDSSWQKIQWQDNLETKPGIHWYRTKINLTGRLSDYDVLQILIINLPSAYEVFWDGKLIASNGTVGVSKDNEILGGSYQMIRIGRSMSGSGSHTIAVRSSNFHSFIHADFSLVIFGYTNPRNIRIQSALSQDTLYIGGYAIAVLFTLMLYLGNNRYKSYLFLLLAFLLILIFWVIDYLAVVNPMPVNYYNYLESSQKWILIAQAVIFIAFILYHFEIPKKILHLISLVLIIIACSNFGILFPDIDLHAVNAIETIYAVGLLILPARQNKPGGKKVFIGYIILFIFYLYVYLTSLSAAFRVININIIFTVSLFIFWYCLVTAIADKIRIQNKQLEEFRLRSLRLETDLLKKSIQPHFLINTLSSVKRWSKKDPVKADKLVEAIANEFRLINKISSETKIPIKQELELCEYHLEIMGYRKDAVYELKKENIKDDELVPPLLFHTLIENGLTHAFESKENGVFILSYIKENGHSVYILRNNGSLLVDLKNKEDEKVIEGMGIKYVKTRLEESFPGRWEMNYGLKNNLWEVIIRIKQGNNK